MARKRIKSKAFRRVLFQTWIVSNSFETPTHGCVYRRTGITPESPVGLSWDKGIGVEWNHVTTRGCIPGMTTSPTPASDSRSSVLTLSGLNLRVAESPDIPPRGASTDNDGGDGGDDDADGERNVFTSITARRRIAARRDSLDNIL